MPAGRLQKADEQLEQDGLAAAAFAKDNERLAARHRQVNLPQYCVTAELDRNALHLEKRRRSRVVWSRTHLFCDPKAATRRRTPCFIAEISDIREPDTSRAG